MTSKPLGFAAFALILLAISAAGAAAAVFNTDHVTVNSAGITEAQAKSLGVVAEAARTSAIDRFGFDVPEHITVNVDCKAGNTVRLFTDGNDTYTLSIRSGDDLAPPATSGIHNLYGMCHELGHVVMYRQIKDHRWMKGSAKEAWAHYFGSRVVDDVYAAQGEKVWWQPYDYSNEGMSRITLANSKEAPNENDRAATAWMGLVEIVGEKSMPGVFAALNKMDITLANPSPAVIAAIKQAAPTKTIALDAWWKVSRELIVQATPMSNFAPASKPAAASAAKPTELALDDGKSKGKTSMAGSGHAVGFETSAEGCKLTAVKIYGSRYGAQQPPTEDFHVYLCDGDGKQIKDFPFPYKNFLRGGEKWVTLKLPEATEVPQKFIVCVSFNPTAQKGVYVHYDAKVDGDSRLGLPGNLNDAFDKGDWMIRAVIAEAAK